MADCSALCCRTFYYQAPSSVSRSKYVPSSRKFSHFPQPQLSSRYLRITAKASSSDAGNFLGDDAFGLFPWAHRNPGIPSSIFRVLCLDCMIISDDLSSIFVYFHNFELQPKCCMLLPFDWSLFWDWSLCFPTIDIKFSCDDSYLIMVSSGLDTTD